MSVTDEYLLRIDSYILASTCVCIIYKALASFLYDLLYARREFIVALFAHFVENIHLKQALFMAPEVALQFSIPDTPPNLISLEMPSLPFIFEEFLLFADNFSGTRLIKVLHGELTRGVDGRCDEDVAVAVANGDTRVRGRKRDGGCENCLSL